MAIKAGDEAKGDRLNFLSLSLGKKTAHIDTKQWEFDARNASANNMGYWIV